MIDYFHENTLSFHVVPTPPPRLCAKDQWAKSQENTHCLLFRERIKRLPIIHRTNRLLTRPYVNTTYTARWPKILQNTSKGTVKRPPILGWNIFVFLFTCFFEKTLNFLGQQIFGDLAKILQGLSGKQ